MSVLYDPDNNTKGAKEFLAEFAKAQILTVEDPSVDPEDTTLSYRLVTLPDVTGLLEG